MDEPPLIQDNPPKAPPPPATSLPARLLNVFAIPGEVFAGVKTSRVCISNWLVPALLLTVVGVAAALIVVSQPAFQRQMRDLTDRRAKALDQQVKAGKVKQVDADRAMAIFRAFTTPVALRGVWGGVAAVVGVARVFWWAFILWLLGRKFLAVRFCYPKALEVAGLGLMINVLGTLVTLLLMVNLPKLFTTRGLAFTVSDLEASRKSLLLLVVAVVFSLWLLGVLALGLAKLANVPFQRAAWFVFAAWVVQESLLYLCAGVVVQFTQ